MKNGGGKKLLFIVAISTAVSMCAFYFAAFKLPAQIHLIEGEEQRFVFSLPLKAKVVEENIGVAKINNKPVTENIHFSLNNPIVVKPDSSGDAKIELSLCGLIPIKTVSVSIMERPKLIPSGTAVGVTMDTDGILVLGTGYVNGDDKNVYEPSKGILKTGDLILKADNMEIDDKEELLNAIEDCKNANVKLTIKRENQVCTVNVAPVKCNEDKKNKIGVWVRDSTQGIGTVTYMNPKDKSFGALGHGIYDTDTKGLMKIKNGRVVKSTITGIKKSEKGIPGELVGSLVKSKELGRFEKNTEYGIYGYFDDTKQQEDMGETMEIALQQEVHEGEAEILCSLGDKKVRKYKIQIETVNRFTSSPDKGMIIKIIDKELLEKTGGIIQGMSGSPIIQNGRIVGAVTHVFVQEPNKGYGIFIENMLSQ